MKGPKDYTPGLINGIQGFKAGQIIVRRAPSSKNCSPKKRIKNIADYKDYIYRGIYKEAFS